MIVGAMYKMYFSAVSGYLIGILALGVMIPLPAAAGVIEYSLTIAEEEVNFTGRPVKAMTINGRIPGPTLRFKEGDIARIRVHNDMDVATSIHWHGVLVPPGMESPRGPPSPTSFQSVTAGPTGTIPTRVYRNSGVFTVLLF
jgi:FtsP/CotA-like multicopper oxidase with cupredoxin domain